MDDWFWGALTDAKRQALIDLVISFDDITPIYLNNQDLIENSVLTWFQCFAVEHAMLSKSTLVSLGTGLGKTVMSCGYAERILRENPKSKILFVCLPESIEQIYNDFKTYTVRNVTAVSGESERINDLKNLIDNSEIIVASYKAFYNFEFCNLLVSHFYNDGRFAAIILDEAHEVSQESIINSIMNSLCRKIEYKLLLTATPITVVPEQIISLMNMMDCDIFPEGKDYLKPYRILDPETFEVMDYRHLDNLANCLFPHYVSWTRSELGLAGNYTTDLILVKPDDEQIKATSIDIPTLIKGKRDSNQVKVFLAICKGLVKQNKKGLVYASRHENSQMLLEELTEIGIHAAVVNGERKNKVIRKDVLHDFKNGKVDILITRLTMSLNLDSDFVIYWENTNRAVQMVGRCERGFIPKDLYICYLLTENTVELEQFYRTVYLRCKWLKESLDKDISIFEKFHNALENYYQRS